MTSRQPLIYICPCLLFFALLFHCSRAEVGTAAFYNPPYLPSACYGRDESKFPSDNMSAAAGEGIWDNGVACGRVYRVRCLSNPHLKNACIPGSMFVLVTIVDRAATSVSRPSTNSTATFFLNVNVIQIQLQAHES